MIHSRILACFAGGMSGMIVLASAWVVAGCAGPQPLKTAIRSADQAAYAKALNASNADAKLAFTAWMAGERGASADEIVRRDAELSAKKNPFDAHNDMEAVSRGAVIYQVHCARCHGADGGGGGPSSLNDHPSTSFKTFGKRLAATLHRGAPRKWFRVIREGSGDVVTYPDGEMTAMPPFQDQLTREQIWLVITYLQSLDIHAEKPAKG